MDELTQLAIKYGTDKWGKHHYTPVYYDLLNDSKERIKSVLEIGPAEGAGLFMFREFFPNATIYGAEIDQDRVNALQGLDRIEVYKCDQSLTVDLLKMHYLIEGDLDLVIDDGSHIPEHQAFTCLTLMPYLKDDVIYIIEDVSDPSIILTLSKKYNCEMIEVGSRYDDRLIIVRK